MSINREETSPTPLLADVGAAMFMLAVVLLVTVVVLVSEFMNEVEEVFIVAPEVEVLIVVE